MEHQIFVSRQGDRWRAIVPTLPHCETEATTENEAIVQVKRLAKCILEEQAVIPLEPLPLDIDDDLPSLEEIVARIKATPPNPTAADSAEESLGDFLRETHVDDPDFDEIAWNRQWAEIEAAMNSQLNNQLNAPYSPAYSAGLPQ